MYPCQNVPMVVFGARCSSPCLYCGLYKYQFPAEKIIAVGIENVKNEMSKYKSTYFSPVTDCFLPENCEATHFLLEKVWKLNPDFVPLVNTKQIIPEKTVTLFKRNKDRLVLQISVPSSNEILISILEPGSASVSARLKMLKNLTENGVPAIVVIMPWFDLGNSEELARKISEAGIIRAIISNGILVKNTKEKMINSGNEEIKKVAESVCFVKEATENRLVLPRQKRIESLTKMVSILKSFGIKVRVCTSDNHDLSGTGLPLCGNFKHHNWRTRK